MAMHLWSANPGTPTAPYADWATAALNLNTIQAAVTAGDTVWVAHDHAESVASIAYTFPNGTNQLPIKVICGTRDTVSGISAETNTATINVSGTSFSIGGAFYMKGVTIQCNSTSLTNMRLSDNAGALTCYEDCGFYFGAAATNSGNRIYTGSTLAAVSNALTRIKSCRMRFAQSSQHCVFGGKTEIDGLTFVLGSGITPFCELGTDNRGGILIGTNIDFSPFSAVDIFATGGTAQYGSVRNSKMHASWSGDIFAANPSGGTRWELINFGVGDTNYKFWTHETTGQCRDDTTVYRDAGSTDDSSPPIHYSQKMISGSSAVYPGNYLKGIPYVTRVAAGTHSIVWHYSHDGTALTDKEFWVEVEYLGTSGFPLGSTATGRLLFTLTATTNDSSGVSWTGNTGTINTGGGTWTQAKTFPVIISVAETCYMRIIPCLAKPSWTIFADMKPVIT